MSIIHGDCLEVLPTLDAESVHCCVTSPPYWGLRDYGVDGQLGLEKTPEEYVAKLVEIFAEVKRVLRNDGTLWLNLGDSYTPQSTHRCLGVDRGGNYNQRSRSLKDKIKLPPWGKPKDLCGIPWRVAFALQADGWYLRQDIIWHKPNPMPESVRDRCTKAHEYIFLLSKNKKYYYDADAIKEPWQSGRNDMRKHGVRTGAAYIQQGTVADNSQKGERLAERDSHDYQGGRNKRSVWTVTTKPYKGAHFATFPPDLIEPSIKAGCPEGGTVLDPFMGSGTTAYVSRELGRNYLGVELNQEYIDLANKRLKQDLLPI